MINSKASENRQFRLMLEPAIERLKAYSVDELCQKGNIRFSAEDNQFILSGMGREIRIHYPDFSIDRELEMWYQLTLLQYMSTADGSPLSGNWIDLSRMRGGLSRGIGFNRDITAIFENRFADITSDDFQSACLRLGGTVIAGKADVTAIIPFAPMFPVLLSYWEGDDEFQPSGKVLVDENADHYLTIEAAGTACAIVVNEILAILNATPAE